MATRDFALSPQQATLRRRGRRELIRSAPRLNQAASLVSDDSQLIEQTLAGDSAAFGQLVIKYQDRLYHGLVQMLGCAEDARDIVQEALVQAFVKLDSFQGHSAFYTWLYRIAWNRAVSSRRRQRPVASVDAAHDATGAEPVAEGELPADVMSRQEDVAAVKAALAQIGETHRAVLVLREIDGMSYEEISQILDLQIGTVRSRLHRARSQLRDLLIANLQDHDG